MTAELPDHTDSRNIRPAERDALQDAIRRAPVARGETGKAGIAAAVMRGGEVIATGENEVHLQADPTRHAEMVAITRAARDLETSDLSDCVLISTLQPREMCLSAMRFVRIGRVVFAATQARVATKYFAFPHLKIADFQNWAVLKQSAEFARTASYISRPRERNELQPPLKIGLKMAGE